MIKAPRPKKPKAEKPKRLTPSPEVLRQLYLLSGNQCAMPECDNLIIDGNGVVLGHICHIRAAMPEGARFDENMTNNDRRQVANLVLMCGGHHTQIDSKIYEKEYTLEVVKKIKSEHEGKLKGVGASLRKAFKDGYTDVTDSLRPTKPETFVRLEATLPDCCVRPSEVDKRKREFSQFIDSMSVVPPDDRAFILAIIRRAIKLKSGDATLVHVNDAAAVLGLKHAELKQKGKSLSRYGVGDIDHYSNSRGDEEPHVRIMQPSRYVSWYDINDFCDKQALNLEDFVLRLRFDALDQ